jgi:hypothetical protein
MPNLGSDFEEMAQGDVWLQVRNEAFNLIFFKILYFEQYMTQISRTLYP